MEVEVNEELLKKAIIQAIANVSLEDDSFNIEEEKEVIKTKVLGGINYGRMGGLSYRRY